MKVNYKYDQDKDTWCVLNKGKSSNNSPHATEVYKELTKVYGDNPTENETSAFIGEYLLRNKISPQEIAEKYQRDWNLISDKFQKRAEEIFKTSLPHDVNGYLTVNQRSPYDIKNDYFYVSLHSPSARKITMHELWHFYTWYGLGTNQEEKLGKKKYNDLKEALTVLINIECKDLFSEGVIDKGYPQHQELRGKISEFWSKDRNIFNLWEFLKAQVHEESIK